MLIPPQLLVQKVLACLQSDSKFESTDLFQFLNVDELEGLCNRLLFFIDFFELTAGKDLYPSRLIDQELMQDLFSTTSRCVNYDYDMQLSLLLEGLKEFCNYYSVVFVEILLQPTCCFADLDYDDQVAFPVLESDEVLSFVFKVALETKDESTDSLLEKALDMFHSTVPIATLDDFSIKAELILMSQP